MSYNWMYFSFTGRWALARGGEGGGGWGGGGGGGWVGAYKPWFTVYTPRAELP